MFIPYLNNFTFCKIISQNFLRLLNPSPTGSLFLKTHSYGFSFSLTPLQQFHFPYLPDSTTTAHVYPGEPLSGHNSSPNDPVGCQEKVSGEDTTRPEEESQESEMSPDKASYQ